MTIIDKEARVGGNSAKASSGINAANSKYQQAQGIEDSIALFMKDTLLSGGGIADHNLAKTLAVGSADAMDFLVNKLFFPLMHRSFRYDSLASRVDQKAG